MEPVTRGPRSVTTTRRRRRPVGPGTQPGAAPAAGPAFAESSLPTPRLVASQPRGALAQHPSEALDHQAHDS